MRRNRLSAPRAATATAVAAALALLLLAGAARPLLAEDEEPTGTVISSPPPLFTFHTPEDARKAWRPAAGSPEVGLRPTAGQLGLAMDCPFQGTNLERASWDSAVRLDLRFSTGVTFEFWSADASAVSRFSFYFHSGSGWYAGSFSPPRSKGWVEVTVRTRDTDVEGAPAGWGSVDAVRVSAWRGRDENASFCLATFGILDSAVPVGVVRAETAAPGFDPKAGAEYAGRAAAFLEEAGAAPAFLSDRELAGIGPGKLKVLILPFNPQLSRAAVDSLRTYLEEGGKLIAFYQLPPALLAACDIAPGPYLRAKTPGQFALIRTVAGELPGAPAAVRQRSWNIQAARPVEGKGRVAAVWCDEKGNDTGEPAIVLSRNLALMTHVLLPDDPAGKRRLLLALAARFAPEAWGAASAYGLARAGRVGPAEDLEDLERLLRREKGDPGRWAEALEAARSLLAEARALRERSKHEASAEASDRARESASAAWCRGQTPRAGEHRAFWCHSAFGVEGATWDEAAKALADNGFTAVIPNLLWGGTAYYGSAVLPPAPEVAWRGDQAALCLAACRRHGIACHVWKVCWNMGGKAPKAFAERMRREGRTQVRLDGAAEPEWLCPSHPENQALEIAAMAELAAKYEIDGIQFDYIRYPGPDSCFCAGCRERFEKAAGARVAKWPADLRSDKALAEKWRDFRRAQISRVVEEASAAARRARPGIRVSAAVFPNWPLHRQSVAQDWKLWCDRGWLDFVCPMDYTESEAEFANAVSMQKEWAGKAACYPGIGLSCWSPGDEAVRTVGMIRAARAAGVPGFTVFNLGPREAREVLPMLGAGITRK
ncbi:MAG: family 10 glycosylhydrolase [Planctomycetes bacterium]|nr:family 10 glycosylhydrolase [Planctomycetota bacterium]